jgi:hypothetical protein
MGISAKIITKKYKSTSYFFINTANKTWKISERSVYLFVTYLMMLSVADFIALN